MHQAKLFQNGQSQAVRLPKEFRFEGNSVGIKRLGRAVVLFPQEAPWSVLFDSLNDFSPDFMDDRNQPPEQIREDLT